MPHPSPLLPVVKWYRVYCALMVLLYLGVIALVIIGIIFENDLVRDLVGLPRWGYIAYFAFVLGICGALGATFLVSFFLPSQPWTWVYHLVLICIGLTSPCCMPASIPLLIYWIRPETRAYFGRN